MNSLINEAVAIAKAQGLSQAEWCRRAGFDEFGKLVCNAIKRDDIKLETFVQLLEPLGCELAIVREAEEA